MCLLFFAGCNRRQNEQRAVSLDELAGRYVRLAVALGEHDKDSIDYYYGDPAPVSDIRKNAPSLPEIRRSALELIGVLKNRHSMDAVSTTRQTFLAAQLEAIACRSALLAGQRQSFDEESRCSFGVVAPTSFDEARLRGTRGDLAKLLPGDGPLAMRYARFEQRFVIPRRQVRAVMEKALAGCRAQTLKHMDLPKDESVKLELTGDEPWAAYSLYLGHHRSVVTVNVNFPITIDRALDLACHEAYPGHHTFNMTQDDALVANGRARELAVQPTYSPQSFLTEGAATMAAEVAFSPAERLRFERETLLPAAAIGEVSVAEMDRYLKIEELLDQLHPAIPVIARRYLDGELEFVRAAAALEDEALMGGTFETLKYLNEFRVYVIAYTYAPDLLWRKLPARCAADAEERRWATYTHWMKTEPVSLSSAASVSAGGSDKRPVVSPSASRGRDAGEGDRLRALNEPCIAGGAGKTY